MEHHKKLKEKDYEKIKEIAYTGFNVHKNSLSAQYISELQFIRSTIDVMPNVNNILGEIVSIIKSGAGPVRDKEQHLSYLKQKLYTLERYVQKDDDATIVSNLL